MKYLFSKFLVAFLLTSAVVLSWSEYFFEKRITILPFSSKTNLAYKVATKIGTLVFKTSDFKNKRRYLFAQSVQFFMFGFSNSNLTKDRYTYTIYMGSAFRQVLFFLQKFFFLDYLQLELSSLCSDCRRDITRLGIAISQSAIYKIGHKRSCRSSRSYVLCKQVAQSKNITSS